MIRYKKDRDNIATLILDMENQPINVINHEIIDAFVPVIQYLKKERSRDALKGVIITSAKRNFLEGGNWEYLYRANNAGEVLTFTNKLKQIFRDIEYPGAPVAAAINGNALGGGFDLALACHYRIALDQPKIRLGLPEVGLGLIPGGGGLIRLMWLLGIEKTFHLLAQGRTYEPREALRVGIIDDVANSYKELIEKAKQWLLKSPSIAKPWDTKSKTSNKSSQEILEIIRRLNIELVKEKQMLFPAQHAILNILAESFRLILILPFLLKVDITQNWYVAQPLKT